MFFVSYKRPTQVQPCHKNETDNFMNDDEIGHSQFLHFFIGVHGGCPRRSVEMVRKHGELEHQSPELEHQPDKGERRTTELARQPPRLAHQLPHHIRKESACRFLLSCLGCLFMWLKSAVSDFGVMLFWLAVLGRIGQFRLLFLLRRGMLLRRMRAGGFLKTRLRMSLLLRLVLF